MRISGFSRVRTLAYLLFCLVLPFSAFSQQGGGAAAFPVSFEDSVRIVLENTKNVDATVIGSSFVSNWTKLNLQQQKLIKGHALAMRKKKFPLKPHLINYYGSIVSAINLPESGSDKLMSFLNVTSDVIEKLPSDKAFKFFNLARTFLQHNALHYEKSFRLYANGENFSFKYLEPQALPSWDDMSEYNDSESSENFESGEEGSTDDTADEDEFNDSFESFEEITPSYPTPPPPPDLFGPVISFEKVSFNIVTKYDSVFLTDTKGKFSLTDNLFVGEGGKFDWTAAGLNPDSVYCNFETYFFNASKPEIKADLVKLNYVGKTPGLIAGSFEFRTQQRKDSVASSYPRFKSYQSNLKITGLAEDNVKYQGGFSLTGARISSASFSGDPAKIDVFLNNERKFSAASSNFIFTPNEISAERASVSILQRDDSIFHSAVRMRYLFPSDSIQRLIVLKDNGDMRYAPYESSYFNIDFAVDAIYWDMLADSFNLRTDGARHTVPMIIESVDYYDAEDFRLLKGSGFRFHPLGVVANYAQKNGLREFYAGDIATATGQDLTEMQQAIEFLAQKGMLYYDKKTGLVRLKDKTVDVYNANRGEVDYDNLKIHSVIDSFPNATVNLKKGYMTVRGVEEFDVSDSLNVHIKPDSSVITLLKNRDIKFNGTIDAGNFQISGKGFTLQYQDFLIDLEHIDSINFYVTEKNAKGQEVRRKINNSMVGADSTHSAAAGVTNVTQKSGTLYISKANNKSGKEKVPNYPRLDASGGGVIYFDRPEVLGGVYDRSMFFVAPPFKLDSLNDADPAAINFDGTFVSSGMFPSFEEKLHTQPDKSLGFTHTIPKDGYQLYKGEGKMYGFLDMNNRGLRGAGHIDYLAAHISSDDFIYYPDSVVARGTYSTIRESQFGDVNFPDASLTDFEMKWLPKKDRMMLKNRKAPFSFYDSTAQMQGILTVSKNGVAGLGKFETRGTELISRDMKFTATDFSARHARFKVRSADPEKPLFTGHDVRLKFNVRENYADISPEVEGVAAIDFPFAQVRTSIPRARWFLDEQKILMSKDPNVPIENSYFYTTRKELDSLHFNAEKAEYNLRTQELKVSGIPYIVVADAKITPENNEVLILENARIGTLKNTTIIVDTLNGYHRLTEGVVDIISRKEFSGYATYQYVNHLNDTFAIKMTDFHLEPVVPTEGTRHTNRRRSIASMQTVATGAVTEQDNIVLGAGMYYKGNMIMYATRPALQLDGFLKPDIRKIPNYNTWLRYSQSGEETDVIIEFDNALTEDGRRANAGLHFGANDNDLYMTFINEKKNDEDDDFFTPSGSLWYNKETNEFLIEDPEKAAGNKLSGKIFAYNDETRMIRFEGPINIFHGTKDFNVTATTIGNGSAATNEYRMNTMVMMDSNVPSTAFDLMAKNLRDVIQNEGANEGLGDHTELLYKIADVVGEQLVKDYEQKSIQGYVSLGTLSPLVKPLVFADVNLKWHPKLKAFYSEGLLGVSNILRHDINGGFEGFMEFKETQEGGPTFHVFLKASSEAWYYFGFEDNRLLVHSSNQEFNEVISKKSNAGKVKVGEIAFIPGTEDETLSFINRFRKDYYGIDVPYLLYEAGAPVETAPVTPQQPTTIPGDNTEPQQQPTQTEDEEDEDDGF